MRRLIIFLIRLKFGLRKKEFFRFSNQKTNNYYYFTSRNLMKWDCATKAYVPSNVKFNWLMDDECEIIRVERDEW
jgi:hypothetical protein